MINNTHDIILGNICNFLIGKNLSIGNRLRDDLLRKCINSNEILYSNAGNIMSGYNCFTIFKSNNFSIYFSTFNNMINPGVVHIDSNMDGLAYYNIFMNSFDITNMELDELNWLIDTLLEYIHISLSKQKVTDSDLEYFKMCYKYNIFNKLIGYDPEIDRLIINQFEGCNDSILELIKDPLVTLYQLLEENMINPAMKGWIN